MRRPVVGAGGHRRELSSIRGILHFAIVAMALLKALLGGLRAEVVLVGAAVYSVFAVWFGLVVFKRATK